MESLGPQELSSMKPPYEVTVAEGRRAGGRGCMAMRVVSFKIDEELLEMLEEYARKRRMTKSEVIRRAIEAYIKDKPQIKPYIGKRIKIYA
jgi:hypothetical protein